MKRRCMRQAFVLLAAGFAVAAAGCRPLVGVKATVRVDEETRLEREVLGPRGEVGPETVLLPLRGDERSPEELNRLHAGLVTLEARLAAAERQDAELRAWQIVSMHNRGVLLARLGRTEQAAALLDEARERSRACGFATLEWQILLT
ncbi:MAG: hypothetical protein ACYS1C_09505, partial [Planctomycetota bacterium]